MAYLGRFFVGDTLPLIVQTTGSDGNPATPDHCPQARIFDPQGNLTCSIPIPVLDRYGQAQAGTTGLFMFAMPVAANIPIVPVPGTTAAVLNFINPSLGGMYSVEFSWSVGSFTGHSQDSFEVVPGGGSSLGVLTSMVQYVRPNADYIVTITDGGGLGNTIRAGRNPRIAP